MSGGFLEDVWIDQFPPLVRGLIMLAFILAGIGGPLLIFWLGGSQ